MDADRLAKLCHASVTKTFIPEKDVACGTPFDGVGYALPESMLSLAGTPELEAMAPERRLELARHELAAMLSTFVRFESVINHYFARFSETELSNDPTLAYVFHVIEEEARHSRMFARCVEELGTGPYPRTGLLGAVEAVAARLIQRRATTFFLSTLCVEDITDRVFARALESENLHPVVVDIARIHRIEESRHMDFMRERLAESYAAAGPIERGLVRLLAPLLSLVIFELLLPPGVYRRVGLVDSSREGRRLWRRARRRPERCELRRFSTERIRSWFDSAGLIGTGSQRVWSAIGLAD